MIVRALKVDRRGILAAEDFIGPWLNFGFFFLVVQCVFIVRVRAYVVTGGNAIGCLASVAYCDDVD